MPEENNKLVLASESKQLSPIIENALKSPSQSATLTRLAAFTPTNLTEAIALSKLIASSDLAPKEYRGKPGNVLIGMQYAAELGISPMLGLSNISIINGRASVWGDLFLAIIQAHPDYEWHKEWFEGQGESRVAICQMKRRGSEVHTVKFGVSDARTARLWGKEGPWKTNPDRMMQMRSRGFAGRDKFSDALKGLRIAEEAMDIPPDNLDVKRQREAATLDVGAVLTPSPEPNRGHHDTGFERTQPESQETKPEATMCGHCGKIGTHDDDCPYKGKDEQEQATSQFTVGRLVINGEVKKQQKKDKSGFFLKVPVMKEDQSTFTLFVFDTKIHFPYLEGLNQGIMRCEYEDGKFPTLKHILSLNGKQFVNDQPVEAEGQFDPPSSGDLGFDQ